MSEIAGLIVNALAETEPERKVTTVIQPAMRAVGDPGLIEIALENLLGNAWKFTRNTADARIEVGWTQRDGQTFFHVRDNGVGFDMAYAHKLFAAFQRLHHTDEFEGTGIGLATVKTIIQRHGGTIRLESAIGAGTTVFFTLGKTA